MIYKLTSIALSILFSSLILGPQCYAQSFNGNPFDINGATASSFSQASSGYSFGNTTNTTTNQMATPSISMPSLPQNVPGLQSAQNGLLGLSSVNMTPIPSAGAGAGSLFVSDLTSEFGGNSMSGAGSFASGPLSYGFPVVSANLAASVSGLSGANDYMGYSGIILPQTSTSSFDGNICDPMLMCRTNGYVDPLLTNSAYNFGPSFGSGFGQNFGLGSLFSSSSMSGFFGSGSGSAFNSVINSLGLGGY